MSRSSVFTGFGDDGENFGESTEDFWTESKINSGFDFDVSISDDMGLKCEIDNEFDAEFLSMVPGQSEAKSKPKGQELAESRPTTKSGVKVMSSMFSPSRTRVSSSNIPNQVANLGATSVAPSPIQPSPTKVATPLRPIINKAADYTKLVNQSVIDKTVDQKFLEEDCCNLLLEQFGRSLIRANNQPRVSLRPDEVIRKLSINWPKSDEVLLEVFRSHSQKKQLIEKACLYGDGNCITRVVLFLRRSLNDQVFRRLMQNYPIGLNHLIAFWKSVEDFQGLEKLYRLFDRNQELLYLLLMKANREIDPHTKLAALQTILHRATNRDSRFQLIASQLEMELITESICLIEAQLKVAAINESAEKKKTNLILQAYPLQTPITSHSVVATAYHCDFYHPNTWSGEVIKSDFYKRSFKLTDKQYQWPFITAKAKLRQWAPIDLVLTQRGLFGMSGLGGSKTACAIGYDNLARILTVNEAPADVVAKYLLYIKDVDERLSVSSKIDCKLAFVLTYIEQRNRQELLRFRERIIPGSKEMHELEKALNNPGIKWKN